MDVTERLNKLLNEKDEQIATLNERIRILELTQEWGDMRHSTKDTDDPRLPCPRLELRYTPHNHWGWHELTVTYALVRQHHLGHYVTTPLGVTTIQSSRGVVPVYDSKVCLPICDGKDLLHDMRHLNLPAWALCDGKIYDLSDEANYTF